MLTISVCSTLVGRTNAVASAKTLPRMSGSSRIVTRAWPLSVYSAPTTLPTLTPATPTAGSFAGLRPFASGSMTSTR